MTTQIKICIVLPPHEEREERFLVLHQRHTAGVRLNDALTAGNPAITDIAGNGDTTPETLVVSGTPTSPSPEKAAPPDVLGLDGADAEDNGRGKDPQPLFDSGSRSRRFRGWVVTAEGLVREGSPPARDADNSDTALVTLPRTTRRRPPHIREGAGRGPRHMSGGW